MALIQWTDALKRGVGFQDDDHQHAVALMNALQTCTDDELPDLYRKLHEHTKAHLARENELMERISFFAIDVHKGEHERVLAEMQAYRDKLNAGDFAEVRRYVRETIPDWFLNHLDSMDTATAMFARQRGES